MASLPSSLTEKESVSIATYDNNNIDSFKTLFKKFEESVSQSYPLGTNQTFRIDHGSNYFSFFKRLGDVYYHCIKMDGKVIGTVASILRKVKTDASADASRSTKSATIVKSVWYICDLKIHPSYRGKSYTLTLALSLVPEFIGICTDGYMISMDPSSSQIINIVKKINASFPFIEVGYDFKLKIYRLNQKDMLSACATLKHNRGHISFLSLKGIKDIIVSGLNDKEIVKDIYHVQFGPFAEHTNMLRPDVEDAWYMFPSIEGSPLDKALKKIGIDTNITATIIYSEHIFLDFDVILTSDI